MNETLISAISYLYENMTDPIDAETLTKELYTSENILRVQFKNRLNSSYKQVLSQFRVRYAEALLTTTSLPTPTFILAWAHMSKWCSVCRSGWGNCCRRISHLI